MTLPNLISHLDTTDMTAAKLWREVRSNVRDRLLDNNQNKPVDVDCTAGGTIVLTVNQREENQLIRLTGTPGAGYIVEFADGNKQFEIENVSGQSATIDSTTGAASPPVITTGNTALIQLHGIELTILGIIGLESGALLHSGQVNPTDAINFADNVLSQAKFRDYGFSVDSPSSSAGTLVLDMENGNYFDVIIDENVTTLTLSNPPASGKSGTIIFIATQNGVGGNLITWPGAILWEQGSGESPSQTVTSDAVDIYMLMTMDAGTTWYGIVLGLDMR